MSNYAIYKPVGRAAEYSEYACNFYTGCSNDCSYCYCKRGVMSHVWSNAPRLKKCFKDEEHALNVFNSELLKNVDELIESGVFFSFTTDPMLPETIGLTISAINSLVVNGIHIKILTKRADWVDYFLGKNNPLVCSGRAAHTADFGFTLAAFGFTLTGHDELEPGASTNAERIAAMRKLHDSGFKTWASIEPIIDIESSYDMIEQTAEFCEHYKVGILSCGKRNYTAWDLAEFAGGICRQHPKNTFYFKESFLSTAQITRDDISCNYLNCVGLDYNIFR